MNGADDNYVQNSIRKTCRDQLGIDGRIILK
jgi:hypothetical protein